MTTAPPGLNIGEAWPRGFKRVNGNVGAVVPDGAVPGRRERRHLRALRRNWPSDHPGYGHRRGSVRRGRVGSLVLYLALWALCLVCGQWLMRGAARCDSRFGGVSAPLRMAMTA